MKSGVRVIRFKELKERVGYSRMHIDRLEKNGKFPRRIRLGENSVAWVESEVDDWISAKMNGRSGATADVVLASAEA
jgi:Predicted transcriptional regulator